MVGLAALPETAVAIRDGKTVKLPTAIEVEDGQVVALEIRADGYETATVKLDGREDSKLVKLTKLAPAPGSRPPATKGSTGLVDPFDPRYRKP